MLWGRQSVSHTSSAIILVQATTQQREKQQLRNQESFVHTEALGRQQKLGKSGNRREKEPPYSLCSMLHTVLVGLQMSTAKVCRLGLAHCPPCMFHWCLYRRPEYVQVHEFVQWFLTDSQGSFCLSKSIPLLQKEHGVLDPQGVFPNSLWLWDQSQN